MLSEIFLTNLSINKNKTVAMEAIKNIFTMLMGIHEWYRFKIIITTKNVDTPPAINPSIVLFEFFLRLCLPYFFPIMQATASAPVVIKTTAPKIGNGANKKGINDNTNGVEATNVHCSSGRIDLYHFFENFGR